MAPLTLPPICLCCHPSSLSFKRGSFLLPFLPSFLLSALWMETHALLCKALLCRFFFAETGQICGQAGSGGYEDVGRLGEQLGLLRL